MLSRGEFISLCAGGVMTIVTGIVLFIVKNYITEIRKLRVEREEKEKGKNDLLLGLTRVSLLETYKRCEQNGYYSLEDREVYGKLFSDYVLNGGNGVIAQLAPKIRMLPTSPPDHTTDHSTEAVS